MVNLPKKNTRKAKLPKNYIRPARYAIAKNTLENFFQKQLNVVPRGSTRAAPVYPLQNTRRRRNRNRK